MFISRQLLDRLKKHLRAKEISLILGPRQVGKTTLILKLQDELKQQGKKTIYFNLDRFEDLDFFTTQKKLLEKIKFEKGESKVYVFIDEIQRLTNAGLFLKGLYDYLSAYKFIVTGSGSLELKENIIEPLTGRKKVFYLYSLSFPEFFYFKTKKKINDFLSFYQFNQGEVERLVDEYLTFGGYPRVILAKTKAEKKAVLEEVYTSYLEKDVRALLGVEKDLTYQHLLKYLAAETGSLIKKSEISRNLGLNIKTLNRYLFLLEKTFVIYLVKPFFKNPTKELTKMPKSYFLDLGLRNFIAGQLEESFWQRHDKGRLFENFVFRQILDHKPTFGIWFWRTESGAEVDFVLNEKEPLPIEVKASEQIIGLTGKSLPAFMDKYQARKAFIVHFGEEKKMVKNQRLIFYKKFLLPHFLYTQITY